MSSHLEYYLDLLSVNDIYISCSQVSDWAVDYSVSGGTDKEGWQYAADFPVYVDFWHINEQKLDISILN